MKCGAKRNFLYTVLSPFNLTEIIMIPIEKAPKDGTEIIGIYKDGTEETIYWNTDRYCMLGRRAGSFPDGWSPASEHVDSNLPLDDEEIVYFREAD